MENRTASVERVTKETKIRMTLNLDGTGKSDIHTGIGFFDHMLDGFARHGLFDLSVSVDGDLDVDGHHTIEDTGIVLGTAIREAVGARASAATATESFRWTRHWCSRPLTSAADRISLSRQNLRGRK